MKKLLLTLTAACAVSAASATLSQTWKNPVSGIFKTGEAFYDAPVAVDKTGAVIAAGIYNVDAAIGGIDLEAIGNSAYIIKYTADGNAAWTVGLTGSATISKIATDKDNNIYVAGQFADEVSFGTTSGNAIVKDGMKVDGTPSVKQNAAFIAKYTSAGAVVSVQTFVPQIQPDLVPVLADKDAFPFYEYSDGDIRFTISDLCIDENGIYAAAVYNGITTVGEAVFDASYVNYLDFMYDDNKCAAVFSLDNSLDNVKIIDQLTSPVNNGDFTEDSYIVWNVRFDVNGKDMVVAYTGSGELSYNGSTIELVKDGKDIAPIFLFSVFNDNKLVGKKVVPATSVSLYSFNAVSDVKIFNGDAYAVGNKYVKTMVDETEVRSNQIYVAKIPALKVEDIAFNNISAMDGDYFYQSTGAAIANDGNIYIPTLGYWANGVEGHVYNTLAGEGTTYIFSTDKFATSDYNAVAIATSGKFMAMSNIGETGATFSLYTDSTTGIADIVADENAEAEYFNLQGVKVTNPEGGLYIVRRGSKVTKEFIR